MPTQAERHQDTVASSTDSPTNREPTAQTLAYYDENARKFASSTANVEFSAMQQKFESLLSPGAKILDFGCGSITSKQNEYVARNDRVYRFLREDIDEAEQYLQPADREQEAAAPRGPDRTNLADASPLEMAFEERFSNVYGSDSTRYLWKEYAITDMEGHDRYIDYLVRTKDGMLGVKENGVRYHHPQIIGKQQYRKQLLKQNSCQYAGIKLYRFSTEDCRFTERFEDDIRSFFGKTADQFMENGIVATRDVQLYEHQEGALEEMEKRRAQGTRCFLAVLPTASGKSKIVEEDLARFAPTQPGFKALIAAPNMAIVDDWKARLHISLPKFENDILVCTYEYINRHYSEFPTDYFCYIVIDEAHHAVAPALRTPHLR